MPVNFAGIFRRTCDEMAAIRPFACMNGIALPDPKHYESARRRNGGELFLREWSAIFYSQRGVLPMTKSIALSLVLAASLGLAACSGGTENAANNAANSAENASNAADNAMNAALNAADNAANAASNATNNTANAM
jgi:hypothetical protein